MIQTPYLWIIPGLLLVLAACGGAGKPTVKLSASSTAVEDGEQITLLADAKGGQGLLKVEFYQGTKNIGEDSSAPYELKLAVTSNEDATLQFSAKVIASDSQFGVSELVGVSVKVDKEAPKISLAASSSKLNAAGSVTLNANATDNKGVVKVEFFKGSDWLGEDTTPADGFTQVVNLNAEQNGLLKYSAKAFDAKGNSTTSAEVSIAVDIDATKPVVSLTSDKSSVTQVGSATLTATATDDKGVAKVEFYAGSNKIAEDTTAPYTHTVNFTEADNGDHSYTAKVTDTNGNGAASDPVTVSVDIDIVLPTVSLASSSTAVTTTNPVTFTATASDAKGIAKVEFYLVQSTGGTTKLSEDTSAPYTLEVSYTATDNGNHSYTARAYDQRGNVKDSEAVTVLVDIDLTPPTIDSFSASSTTVTTTGSITLTTTASDAKGIAKVEFYMVLDSGEMIKLGEDSSSPYAWTLSYSFSKNGYYSYLAKVFNTRGNSATSTEIAVSVNIPFSYTTYPVPGGPEHLAFDQSGNLWFTLWDINKIGKISASDLANCTAASCPRTDYPAAGKPWGIAIDASGNLWFAQTDGNKISKIAASDLASCTPASCPRTDYPVEGDPVGIAFDSAGNLWFTQSTGNKISKITANDLAVCTAASCTRTDYSVEGIPEGITFDSNGNLWFAQYDANKISKISASDLAACTAVSCIRTDYPVGDGPDGLAFDSSGNLWFTQWGSNTIGKITAIALAACTPAYCNRTEYEVSGDPDGIAFDSQGNLWFSQYDAKTISKVTF